MTEAVYTSEQNAFLPYIRVEAQQGPLLTVSTARKKLLTVLAARSSGGRCEQSVRHGPCDQSSLPPVMEKGS